MGTSEEAVGQRLSRTSLRDFRPAPPDEKRNYDLPLYREKLSREEAPIPPLLRHALNLIGISHSGPAEKVAWWASFSYKGYACDLVHRKFGLWLHILGDLTEVQADDLMAEMRQKLAAAVAVVEKSLAETARDTLNAGNVTVINQHGQLRRAYGYFRERAEHPDVVEDVSRTEQSEHGTWSTFSSGQDVMAMNAFHDLVAAISAFMSSLEHDLVLMLPFEGFKPTTDDLTGIIGDRWGLKWRRVVGHADPEAVRLYGRLAAVVERWRNPYSHGGFEKGHGATIYVHTPGLGALPVGLSDVRDSPLFSFHPASEADIDGVFRLFDEIDTYLAKTFPHAMEWIASGLDVQFDADFRTQVANYIESDGNLQMLIDAHHYRADMIANMDF